ncbi:MAG: hypothetical protein ABIP30_13655 [Ferruginibacter sp.]
MKKILIPAAFLLILNACNNSSNSTEQKKESVAEIIKDTVVTPMPAPSAGGCYMMVVSKDTAFMHLEDSTGFLSGHLMYKRFEKDSNKGVVTLSPEKDGKIHGWYNFASEGTQSVREIVFKVTDSTMAEGYGDVKMKGDTIVYKYPTVLKFEEKHPFKKTDCK